MKVMIRILTFALAALLLAFGTTAIAQDEPAGNIVEMWTFHVAKDNNAEFEEAMKAHVALRKEAGDPFHWETYTKHTGSLAGYYVRACCFTWADRDAYEGWYADNPQVAEHFQANVDPLVKGYEHDFEEMDFENSHWPPDSGPFRYVGVTTYKIAPGGWSAVSEAKRKLSQAGINEGWASDEHRWAWASSVNGHPSIALVVPFKNYADMAEPEPNFYQFLSEALGEDEVQALFEQFSSGTKGTHYEIYTHRPDLSMPE